MGSSTVVPASSEGYFEQSGRPRLFYRWFGAEPSRASVLIVHGFGEHGGRYAHVAAALGERGYSACAIDYRGWGKADGRRAFVRSYDEYTQDLEFAVARLRADRIGDAPLFLLGHSQGGLVAALYALGEGAEGLSGLVLTNPAFRFAVPVPAWKRTIGAIASRLWPTFSLPSAVEPGALTHDPEMLARMEHDTLLVQRATARWYTESLAAQESALTGAAQLRVPLLLLLSGADRIADATAGELFYAAVGGAKSIERYPGQYHEILNELPEHRERALSRIADWIDRTLDGTPGLEGSPES